MKILQVLPRFDQSVWGATENLVWHLSRELMARGTVCTIAATREPAQCALEVVEGIEIHRFLCAPERWRWHRKVHGDEVSYDELESPALDVFLRKNRFDLIHCFAFGSLARDVYAAAAETGIPFIMHCRSCDYRSCDMAQPPRGGTAERRMLLADPKLFEEAVAINSEALAGADLVLAGDRNLTRGLSDWLENGRVEYFPPGVDYDYFNQPAKVDFRSFYQIPPQRAILLAVGGILSCKNQKALIETVMVLNNRGKNCHLVLLGAVLSRQYLRELEAIAAERAMGDRMTVIPGLPPGDERFRAAYQSAALVVQPSQYDVVGMTVLEAFAAGAVTCVARVGGGSDLVRDGENGFFGTPSCFPEWIARCERLLDPRNYAELEKIRVAAYKTAREFRWELRAADLLNIYQRILERNHGKTGMVS